MEVVEEFISEPIRGRRNWIGKEVECDAVYAIGAGLKASVARAYYAVAD
ncbi:MAG TPA: hypothetical protein VE422_09705 [Terriglobia bacterium]|nr:hypothetical protein [Terriglobia bacterium]